jgi:hypothetical protein
MITPMTAPSTFFDVEDTVDPELPPPPPVTKEVVVPAAHQGEVAQQRFGHLFQHGTTVAETWDADWVTLVVEAEKRQGRAICGAKRKSDDLTDAVVSGEMTAESLADDPLVLVCKSPAGLGTDHPGEGRCTEHGGHTHLGTLKTGRFSLLRHNKLSPRVHEFFENEGLLDLRNAIALIYAAMDEMLADDEEITPARAQEIGNLMSKVGSLTKQHNEITASKQISIEVPEFMAWAEYFYELAIKYIQDGKGDVAGFLRDAQQFYNATVTLTIGDSETQAQARRDSSRALGQGSDQ